jgi:hypothetical protein
MESNQDTFDVMILERITKQKKPVGKMASISSSNIHHLVHRKGMEELKGSLQHAMEGCVPATKLPEL